MRYNIQLSPEGKMNSAGYIYRDAKRQGIYLALFTDPEGDSCFNNYQISWIKQKKSNFLKLKTSLGRNFVNNLQTFRGFVKCILRFCCKFSMNIIFYLTSDHREAKFLAFLVFVCTTASFIVQISSSGNVSKRHAILAPVAKQ